MASAIHLVNWIPVVGLPLNGFAMLLATLGLRRLHASGPLRAALIGLSPAVALLAYFAVVYFAPE
jgi:hypothetical protein